MCTGTCAGVQGFQSAEKEMIRSSVKTNNYGIHL